MTNFDKYDKIRTIGGTVGAGVGLFNPIAGGMISAASAITANALEKSARQRQEQEYLRQQAQLNMYAVMANNNQLSTFRGNDVSKLYALGGGLSGSAQLPVENTQRLGSYGKKVVNAGTHAEGQDVPVSLNGQQVGLVENGEVIQGTKVYSQQLGTAQKAEQLLKYRAGLELAAKKEQNPAKRGTIQKQMDEIDKALNNIFQAQEAAKRAVPQAQPNLQTQSGMPQFALGENLMKWWNDSGKSNANQLVPYMDNIYAAISQQPYPNKPAFAQAIGMNTDVNVQPQINDISLASQRQRNFITQNYTNPYIAAGLVGQNTVSTQEAIGKVYDQAAQYKAQLQPQAAQLATQVGMTNAQAMQDFNQQSYMRSLLRRQEMTENVANVASKQAAQQRNDEALTMFGLTNPLAAENMTMLPGYQDYLRRRPDEAKLVAEGITDEVKRKRFLEAINKKRYDFSSLWNDTFKKNK